MRGDNPADSIPPFPACNFLPGGMGRFLPWPNHLPDLCQVVHLLLEVVAGRLALLSHQAFQTCDLAYVMRDRVRLQTHPLMEHVSFHVGLAGPSTSDSSDLANTCSRRKEVVCLRDVRAVPHILP